MTRHRRGESQRVTAGSSAANTPAAIGKATLTQALPQPVPAPGHDAAGAPGEAPVTSQRNAEWRTMGPLTRAIPQPATHDIAALFGAPSSVGTAPVQRKSPPVPVAPGTQATAAAGVDAVAQPGMWEHAFG